MAGMTPEAANSPETREEKAKPLYTSERYLSDLRIYAQHPGEIVDPQRVVFSLGGLPALVYVGSSCACPLEDGGSPQDVLKVSVHITRMGEGAERIAERGYTDAELRILHLNPEQAERLSLESDRPKLQAMVHGNGLKPRHGRELEYEVTREELPSTVPIIAAFLRARAVAYGMADGIERDDVLMLFRGGLVGSCIANISAHLLRESPDDPLLNVVKRAEPHELRKIDLPLSNEDRRAIDVDDPDHGMNKLAGYADRVALAVVLDGDEASEDYAMAVRSICSQLINKYESPQAKDNYEQFVPLWTRRRLQEQERLAARYEAQGGYQLENFVAIPKPSGPASFALPIPEALTTAALAGSSVETHYRHNVIPIVNPDTELEEQVPWLEKDKEFLRGPKVDEVIADGLQRGYIVVTKPGIKEPLTKELCALWDLIQRDIYEPRRPAPIDAFVCVKSTHPELGRVFALHFEDQSNEMSFEDAPRLQSLREKLDSAFAELPEQAREIVSQNFPNGHQIYEGGGIGDVVVCEKHPAMLELLFDYLRERAADEWAKTHS